MTTSGKNWDGNNHRMKSTGIINTLIKRCGIVGLVVSRPKLWHAFGIESHLTYKERVRLFSLAKKATTIIEVGSYLGASTCCMASAIKPRSGSKIICIDTWQNDTMSEGRRDTYEEFVKNTAPFANIILPVRGFSSEVVAQVESLTDYADLLFIDGSHHYEAVRADWSNYRRFLRPGAVVAFHDWGWAEGVQRVVVEDVKPLTRRWEALPNLFWAEMGEK